MAADDIAFRLMQLYRVLRGPADPAIKHAVRAEIDALLRMVDDDDRPLAPTASNDNSAIQRRQQR